MKIKLTRKIILNINRSSWKTVSGIADSTNKLSTYKIVCEIQGTVFPRSFCFPTNKITSQITNDRKFLKYLSRELIKKKVSDWKGNVH